MTAKAHVKHRCRIEARADRYAQTNNKPAAITTLVFRSTINSGELTTNTNVSLRLFMIVSSLYECVESQPGARPALRQSIPHGARERLPFPQSNRQKMY